MKVSEILGLMAHLKPDDEVRFHMDPEQGVIALVRWEKKSDDLDAKLTPVEPVIVDISPKIHPIDLQINEAGAGNEIRKTDENRIILPKQPNLKVIK